MPKLRFDVDKESFDAMISAINALNFEVNTFKGINIGKEFNLGKFTANRNLYGNNLVNEKYQKRIAKAILNGLTKIQNI